MSGTHVYFVRDYSNCFLDEALFVAAVKLFIRSYIERFRYVQNNDIVRIMSMPRGLPDDSPLWDLNHELRFHGMALNGFLDRLFQFVHGLPNVSNEEVTLHWSCQRLENTNMVNEQERSFIASLHEDSTVLVENRESILLLNRGGENPSLTWEFTDPTCGDRFKVDYIGRNNYTVWATVKLCTFSIQQNDDGFHMHPVDIDINDLLV